MYIIASCNFKVGHMKTHISLDCHDQKCSKDIPSSVGLTHHFQPLLREDRLGQHIYIMQYEIKLCPQTHNCMQ